MTVEDFYKIRGYGFVLVGKIETGKLTKDTRVEIFPYGCTARVESITYTKDDQFVDEAQAGACVGINIRELKPDHLWGYRAGETIKGRGMVFGCNQDDPIKPASRIVAQILVVTASNKIK